MDGVALFAISPLLLFAPFLRLFLRRPIQRSSRGINMTQLLVGLAGVAQQLQLDVKQAPFETFELTPVYMVACRRSLQIGLANY